jgi:hypothetical protein
VTNDLDTLATAPYVRTDDLLKEAPDLAPWRPRVGIAPRLTDAELVTLAVMQALLGFTAAAPIAASNKQPAWSPRCASTAHTAPNCPAR